MEKSPQSAAKDDNVEDQAALQEELQYNTVGGSESSVHDMYDRLSASQEQIDQFVNSSTLYDSEKKSWKKIRIGASEDELSPALKEVFDAIHTHFGAEANRHPVFAGKGHHEEGEGMDTYSSSDPTTKDHDLSNIVDPSEMTKEDRSRIAKLAVYARQCFKSGLDRPFVRALLVTDRIAHLYQFDHFGAQCSRCTNIHDDPSTFVRLVLGVNTLGDGALASDAKTTCRESCDGTTVDKAKSRFTYTVRDIESPFSRHSIRHRRGAAWWPAMTEDGTRFVVKTWNPQNQTPEWECPEGTQSPDGAGWSVVGGDSKHAHELRGESVSEDANLRNLMFVRIGAEGYSAPIDEFKSKEEFMSAFRDAIAGHRGLFNGGILHRDVGVRNILISPPGASKGNRGILVDFDLAVPILRAVGSPRPDDLRGTRMFQSINVLHSYDDYRPTRGHTYLDDLESFFYVFCFVCFGYPRPHRRLKTLYLDMDAWSADSPSESLRRKVELVGRPLPSRVVEWMPEFWGPPCRILAERFRAFVQDRRREVHMRSTSVSFEALRGIAGEHYDALLKMIDEAMGEATDNAEDGPGHSEKTMQPPEKAEGPVVGPDTTMPATGKRDLDEDPGDSPLSKRQK